MPIMHIEALEPRTLLSSVTYHNDILTIIGSPGRDRIRLGISIDSAGNGFGLVINGHRRTPPALNEFSPEPGEIRIQSRAGNDSIKVSLWMSGAKITIDGGIGDDRLAIHGVECCDVHDQIEMHGGDGNDTLIGGSADEKLFGDAGRDLLKGGEGIDNFSGGPGNDRIYSADANHNELVDGGDGFDRVFSDQDCAAATPAAVDDLISIEIIVCR
jgi:Ca2+-binding RTX toxin-like protein